MHVSAVYTPKSLGKTTLPKRPSLPKRMMGLLTVVFSSLAAIFLIACAEGNNAESFDHHNSFCVEKLAKQTGTPPEELELLTCEDLVSVFPPLPDKYILLREENALFITHCTETNYASALLKEIQFCYGQIEQLLGISPITQCTLYTLAVAEDLTATESQLSCMTIPSGLITYATECEEPEPQAEAEECYFGHEPVHLFLSGTVLATFPPWLNEGLSEWVQATLSPSHSLQCFANGWQLLDNEGIFPSDSGSYVSFAKSREEHQAAGTERDAYQTGACFWDYIVENFSRESLLEIMSLVQQTRFTSMSFVTDILEPTIGDAGVNKLKAVFGEDSIEAYR